MWLKGNLLQINLCHDHDHCVLSLLSSIWLFVTPWTVACRLLYPRDLSSKNTGVGCHFLLQGNLPDPGIKSMFPETPVLEVVPLPAELSRKSFDHVDHNKLWKMIKEMGVPDHLTCLLGNLYAGQEATLRIEHGTEDWLMI